MITRVERKRGEAAYTPLMMPDLPLTPTLLATSHRFLLHTPTNTAILSDLHLGIEHTMRQQGLAFPTRRPVPPPHRTRNPRSRESLRRRAHRRMGDSRHLSLSLGYARPTLDLAPPFSIAQT